MKRDLPSYIYRMKGVVYFVRRGWDTVRLQSQFPEGERVPDALYAERDMILRGVPPVPAGKTFTALIGSYRRSDRFSGLAQRTKADYDAVLSFIEGKWGNLNPARVQRKDIIRMQMDNRGKVRFANYTAQINRVLMEHAIDIGWRTDNPAKGVRMLKSDRPARQPWPEDLIEAFRKRSSGRPLLAFELCIGTGQRIGDVLKMQWGMIKDDAIQIRQGKTGRELCIPLTPRLKAILDETPRRGLFIVSKQNGQKASYRTVADEIMKDRKAIGAEAFDIHSLRHTVTSELAAQGLSDELIQSVTGHTSTASVRRYSEAARQKARASEAQGKRK